MTKLKLMLLLALTNVCMLSAQEKTKGPSDTVYQRQLKNGLKASYYYKNWRMYRKEFTYNGQLLSAYKVNIESATVIQIEKDYFNDTIFGQFKRHADTMAITKATNYPDTSIADFIGNINGLQEFLENNLNYPESSRERKKKGIAQINFFVAKEGIVKSIQCNSSIDPPLIKEAMRVILLTDGFWVPKSMTIPCTIPITFELD